MKKELFHQKIKVMQKDQKYAKREEKVVVGQFRRMALSKL
jgi:hypothetical protein